MVQGDICDIVSEDIIPVIRILLTARDSGRSTKSNSERTAEE